MQGEHPRKVCPELVFVFFQSVTGAAVPAKAPKALTACSAWKATFSTKELVWKSALQLSTGSQTRARVSFYGALLPMCFPACLLRTAELNSACVSLGCDQPCLQCHQADKCSLCPAPFFLLGSLCVPKCGQRYYADEARRKCTGEHSDPDAGTVGK